MAEYLGANESNYRHQTRTRSSVRSSDKTVSLKAKINPVMPCIMKHEQKN